MDAIVPVPDNRLPSYVQSSPQFNEDAIVPVPQKNLPSYVQSAPQFGPPVEEEEEEEVAPGSIIDLGEKPEGNVLDLGDSSPEPTRHASFLKKLDMINTGVHRGVTHFTHKILSLIPSDTLRGRIKAADKAVEDEFQRNIQEYGPGYSKAGEVAGEVLATLPLSGPYGKLAEGASYLGRVAPTGLKTAAKYGASALGGAGLFAAAESQRYDPEHPDQLINKEAAQNVLESPASYLVPMAGTKLSTWMGRSRDLQEARKVLPSVLPRDTLPEGPTRKLSHSFFDALPAITGTGKRVKQLEGIGDDVQNLITKLSGQPEAMHSKDLIKYAGSKLQSGLQKLEKGQSELWNKPFLKAKISDPSAVRDAVVEATDLLKDSGLPTAGRAVKLMQQGLRKGALSVDDVKNIQSVLGKSVQSIQQADSGGIGQEIGSQLSRIRRSLMDPIQKSLSGDQLKDFMAAREYSGRLFEMQKQIPHLADAMTDEIAARKIVRDLLRETEKYSKPTVMGVLPESGKKAVQAAKIAQALEASDRNGMVSLSSFIKRTSEATGTPELLGENYKAIQGLNKYLTSIQEASSPSFMKKGIAIGGLGAAAGASTMSTPAGLGVLASYPALVYISNHPFLKNALGAMTKNMSSSTYNYLSKQVENHLTRAGFYMTHDGELKQEKK